MEDKTTLRTMTAAALVAGKRLLEVKPTRLVSAKDFVTTADLLSGQVIRQNLAARFPEIPFFGEEDWKIIEKTEIQWVVDEVDGTVNFYHGDDHWGISIALVREGRSVAGAIYLPAKKQLFFAGEDAPVAWLAKVDDMGHAGKPEMISVNHEGEADKPLVLLEWVKEQNDGRDHSLVVDILARLDWSGFLYPQVRNSSVASLTKVAQGIAGGFVHPRPEPWDVAAGCLIVELAGGKVTNLAGEPWSPFSAEKGIVASNGLIHDELLKAVSLSL